MNSEMYHASVLSGIFSAIGSGFGKLSGYEPVVGNSYLTWAALLGLMVLANTLGCRFYMRSLDISTNSTSPTVISATICYAISGLIGITFFGEKASYVWWFGFFTLLCGLALIARFRPKPKSKQN